jgi:uncharacterized cupredoxin-like copper-binding protein
MFRRLSLLAIAPVAVALVIAGCGSSNSSTTAATTTKPSSSTSSSTSSSGKGQVLKISADPSGQLRFNTSMLMAKPGKVTIVMDNPASAGMDHGVSIKGNGVSADGQIVPAGKTSTVSATLKKGTYTFYCPVPGHEQAGMKGTLTVQ